MRDYIHVTDLVAAHSTRCAICAPAARASSLNCGYGRGYSVLEVIETVKKVSGIDFPVTMTGRRPAMRPRSSPATPRILAELGWAPRLDDLDTIVAHAYAWERKLGERNDRA